MSSRVHNKRKQGLSSPHPLTKVEEVMNSKTLTLLIAIGFALVSTSGAIAGKRVPVEDVLEIVDIVIDHSSNPVQVTVEVENTHNRTVGIFSQISYAHRCPGNGGLLSGTVTPSSDCVTEATAPSVQGTSAISPGDTGTVKIDFPISIAAGDDYIFFTQVVCSGNVRCDGYLHSFFGLDQ